MRPYHPEYPIPFPLDDVEIRKMDVPSSVENPLFSNNWMSINAKEFSMTVKNVGSFYCRDGTFIEYTPDEKSDPASLELYLNGSLYGAILHQRKILPLHGSSFVYDGKGVMFCGESGAGKSSLTTSFCLKGAEFLTDDVTPVLFENERPYIWPKSGRVKLWDDSLQQLQKEKKELTKIRQEDEKYYFPIHSKQLHMHPMHHIFILQLADTKEVSYEKVEKVEAFSYLHREIYRREFLAAMPETESAYLEQIGNICKAVHIYKVKRPVSISIARMHAELKGLI